MAQKKKSKWIKFRHRFYLLLSKLPGYLYCKTKYGMKLQKFNGDRKRNYLVLYNHQTPVDQLFVTLIVKRRIYFVATEDIFSSGFGSKILKHVYAPIPIDKTSVGISAVKDCMRVAKEGGSIAIAPEGNRTYCGKTGYIKPSIPKLAKALKLPVMFIKIENGYGVHPRWSDKARKGRVNVFVKDVIEPEEVLALSDSELYEKIVDTLYEDEGTIGGNYKSKRQAEYLERAIYVCPHCGFSKWESNKNTAKCLNCGAEIEYKPDKSIKGVNKEFPIKSIGEWFEYQNKFVSDFDFSSFNDKPLFTDKTRLFNVVIYKRKKLITNNATVELFGNKICFTVNGEKEDAYFDNIDGMAVLGRNKLNVKFGGKIYQLKADKRFNALKYLNIYYKHKNMMEENTNGIFLGI